MSEVEQTASAGSPCNEDGAGDALTLAAPADEPGAAAQPSATASSDGSSQLPSKKKTRGRVKIGIKLIDQKQKRSATFHKRKSGLMKKGFELSVLTGAEVLVLASWGDSVFSYSTKKLQKVLTSQTGQDLIDHCMKTPADDLTVDEEVAMRWSPDGYVEREMALPRSEKRKRMKMLREQLMTTPGGKMNATTAPVPSAAAPPPRQVLNLTPLSPSSAVRKEGPDLCLPSLPRDVLAMARSDMHPRAADVGQMGGIGRDDTSGMDLFLSQSNAFMNSQQMAGAQMNQISQPFMPGQQLPGQPMGNPNNQSYMPSPQMNFVKQSVMGGVLYGGYQQPTNRYVFLPPHSMPNMPNTKPIPSHMPQMKMQNAVIEQCNV